MAKPLSFGTSEGGARRARYMWKYEVPDCDKFFGVIQRAVITRSQEYICGGRVSVMHNRDGETDFCSLQIHFLIAHLFIYHVNALATSNQ